MSGGVIDVLDRFRGDPPIKGDRGARGIEGERDILGSCGSEPDKIGYHIARISRGVFGESSKIREELEEFLDAECQGVKLMELQELSDMIGAIQGYLENKNPGTTLQDLIKMAALTDRAFKSGERNARV